MIFSQNIIMNNSMSERSVHSHIRTFLNAALPTGVWKDVVVPIRIYGQMVALCEASVRLGYDLDKIMKSNEHKELLREGAERGFIMPLPDFLSADITNLQKILRESHPYGCRESLWGPDHVMLPLTTLAWLQRVFDADKRVLCKIFNVFETTEYFEFFRYIKEREGRSYEGPTALQAIFRVYARHIHLERQLNDAQQAGQILPARRALISEAVERQKRSGSGLPTHSVMG